MSISEALEAARNGMSSLAKYQKDHPGNELDFEGVDFRDPDNAHINFSGFEFHSTANFRRAVFGDSLTTSKGIRGPIFSNCVFQKHAIFSDAIFGSGVKFDSAIFKDNAVFAGTNFGESANFSSSVITNGSFGHSIFGRRAYFSNAIFIKSCSFEESIFYGDVSFNGAIFERAHFQSSLFADNASFKLAIFAALAQFNNTEFGAGACFRGTSFCTIANFENATFADHASFESLEKQKLIDASKSMIDSLPPEYASIASERVKQANPSNFERATFDGALFSSVQHKYATSLTGAKGIKNIISEGAKEITRRFRMLFYSNDGIRKAGSVGASFAGRSVKKFATFAQVNFHQPPDFHAVEPPTALDFADTHFSFQSISWPHFRYWTTRTSTLTRLRRLRKIMSDIGEGDIERDLFILQRLAERGIMWNRWKESSLRGWGIYYLINSRLKKGQTNSRQLRNSRLQKVIKLCFIAINGIGYPLALTMLAFLYRYSSNFGRSITLPITWFLGLIGVFAHIYAQYSTKKNDTFLDIDLLTFSFSHSFPIGSLSKSSLNALTAKIFPAGLPSEVLVIAVNQTLIQTIFLFLIGLALRNHFRLH